MAAKRPTTPVVVEVGSKRVFASALDWPGWSRSGKDEERALEALLACVLRYAAVVAEAGLAFPAAPELGVVEHVTGNATTDFGAPGIAAMAEQAPLDAAEAARRAALVEASWRMLEAVAATAPASLRKGPRGGGRDRDAIVEHVLAAEAAYARKLGVRGDRAELAAALRQPSDGTPVVAKGWSPRYAARRIAWHVLDHAWEIEDRSEPA